MKQINEALDAFDPKSGKLNFDTIEKDIKDTREGYERIKAELANFQKLAGLSFDGSFNPGGDFRGRGFGDDGEFGGGGDFVGRAQGGMMFRARGTDTIPAMLSEGEFVVNRQATENNRGLLEYINSSRQSFQRNATGYPAAGSPRGSDKVLDDDVRLRRLRQSGGWLYNYPRGEDDTLYRAGGGYVHPILEEERRRRLAAGKSGGRPEGRYPTDEFGRALGEDDETGYRARSGDPFLETDLQKRDIGFDIPRRARAKDNQLPNGLRRQALGLAEADPTGAVADALAQQKFRNKPFEALNFQFRREAAGFQRRSNANLEDGGRFLGRGRAGFDIGNVIRGNDAALREEDRRRTDFLSPLHAEAQRALKFKLTPQGIPDAGGAPLQGQNPLAVRPPAPGGIIPDRFGLLGGGAGIAALGQGGGNVNGQAGPGVGPAKPGGSANVAGGASPEATQAMNLLSKSLNDNIPGLVQALTGFNQSSQTLTEALKGFPSKIAMEGKHSVEVVVNGAEVMTKLEPAIAQMIEAKATEAVQKVFRERLPDAGIV